MKNTQTIKTSLFLLGCLVSGLSAVEQRYHHLSNSSRINGQDADVSEPALMAERVIEISRNLYPTERQVVRLWKEYPLGEFLQDEQTALAGGEAAPEELEIGDVLRNPGQFIYIREDNTVSIRCSFTKNNPLGYKGLGHFINIVREFIADPELGIERLQEVHLYGTISMNYKDAEAVRAFCADNPTVQVHHKRGNDLSHSVELIGKTPWDPAGDINLLTDANIDHLLQESWFQSFLTIPSVAFINAQELSPEKLIEAVVSFREHNTLNISSSTLNDAWMQAYANYQEQFRSNNPLYFLGLTTCPNITSAALDSIAQLEGIYGLCLLDCKSIQAFDATKLPATALSINLGSISLKNGELQKIIERHPHLGSLDLSCCEGVVDADIVFLKNNAPHLNRLWLNDIHEVTEAAIRSLFDMPNLTELMLQKAGYPQRLDGQGRPLSWTLPEDLLGKWTRTDADTPWLKQ